MLLTSTQLFRLSQGHLNLLTACPRKFQHTYLEKLTTPADPQQEEHQTLGSRFHLLMQQREMGLPINSFLEVDSQLQTWMADFSNIAPEILSPEINSQTFRESEHYRTLQIQNYLITVIYDLLVADNEKAQIFDWKTYPQPPDKKYLSKNWQTRLYMYVLAETSEYLPKHISMTYWFVQTKDENRNIQFNYNIRQHQQTEKELNQILEKLTNWLEKYEQNQPFPQEPIYKKSCESCQYAVRCYNQTNQTNNYLVEKSNILPNLANIQEVAL